MQKKKMPKLQTNMDFKEMEVVAFNKKEKGKFKSGVWENPMSHTEGLEEAQMGQVEELS